MHKESAPLLRLLILITLLFAAIFGSVTAHAESETSANTIPPAYQLTVMHVEKAVGDALTAEDGGEKIQANVLGAKSTVLYEGSAAVTPKLSGLTYDKSTERWAANLLIEGADGKVISAVPVGGRFHEVVDVPVLKRSIRHGETITEADIDILEFRLSRLRAEIVRDSKELIGQTPRSVISARRPIRESEFAAPSVLRKNALVKMVYRSGNMEIIVSAQAMEDGAAGDIIPVRNLSSRNIVRAKVRDAQTVTIASLMQPTAKLAGEFHAQTP